MVSQRGIEANPEKIEAIINMQPPGTTKEVQKLTGRIAALNRFISRSSDKGLPFFKILKKADAFSWNEQCQAAFENLKKYLTSPPLLTKPKPGETLFLYLAISEGAVSAVLVRGEARASTHILCQQDPPGAGREIPPNREVGISPGDSCPKVEAIFPITSCGRSNEPPTKEDPGQPKHFRANGEMVHRVERTWY
ncbi:UNVERIFIED_CONTAM: hypothetical protein Sradi_1756200 [Sesamum radiatum]|uniref:Reverse transcriptase/retrotransposon-derived protein RNase H-like domain-containing protein n=1 Tax=Sesamum radiatum TaxID=300843 RepID=A0AAW2TUL0_SESRA